MYRRHGSGEVSDADARELIATTLDVRDRLMPSIEDLGSPEQRAALDERYRALLAQFDPTSVFARRQRPPTDGADAVLDTVDLERREPPVESGTRAELIDRGTEVSALFHFEEGRQVPGPDPERADYNSFLSFRDPDGNGWMVQELGGTSGRT